ncbi:MAG: Choline-sulfatase [Calditrichaeota bacterium]|nr:Choline-sulfatase [Calditrichota bacterium]
MQRRRFIRVAGTAAAGALSLPSLIRSQPEPGPSILLVVFDDLNDWVGCMGGHPDAQTPNIDFLAEQGALFDNGHCSAPQCLPSRTSFLYGKKPSTLGVYTNQDEWEDAVEGLPSLPAHMRANGYRTIQAGKIFHGGNPDDAWDEQNGHHPDARIPWRPNNGFPQSYNSSFDWYPLDSREQLMLDHELADWSAAEINATPEDQPFFLAINLFRTHIAYTLPRRYYRMYDPMAISLPERIPNDLDDIPQAGLDMITEFYESQIVNYKQRRQAVAAYLAGMSYTDAMLGRLLEGAAGRLFDGNTIIWLVSDHGSHCGEKEHWLKGTLWEESTHIPYIVNVPGITQPGSVCHQPASLLDLYPSLVELTSVPDPGGLEGLSLQPWLIDPETPREEPALTTFGPGNHAVRTDRWRYIRYADLSEELYDHDNDPNEWTNVADDPQYDDLKEELAQWMPDDGP